MANNEFLAPLSHPDESGEVAGENSLLSIKRASPSLCTFSTFWKQG